MGEEKEGDILEHLKMEVELVPVEGKRGKTLDSMKRKKRKDWKQVAGWERT